MQRFGRLQIEVRHCPTGREHDEGFGLVLLEAMVNRLPCIAFDSKPPEVITASREIIVHEKTGFVVDLKRVIEDLCTVYRAFVLFRVFLMVLVITL